MAGWYTIDLTSTVCDSFGVRTHTDTKLLQDGIDPKLYDRIIYAFPKMNCGYSGSGQVGGVPTTAFVNNQFGKTGTLFHEYGHNLGLGHAMAYQCDDATLGGTNCHKIVYGDTLDVMGDSRVEYGTFNPYNRMFLGWLDKEQVIEVTQNSTVNIIPYTDNKNLGPKVIKIPKPGHPGHWFTIDFHQAIGLDNKLIYETDLVTANILNGVIIRETEDGASYLLNATPASSWSRYYDMRDPALEVGNSFQDPYSGVRITTLMASTGGATVQVEFTGEQSCREGGISLGNLDAINAYPDRTSNVSLSIDSQNSTACGDDIVTATTSVSSAGLSVDFGDQPISLVAAKSTKVPFTVTAATGMAYGRYTITPTFTTSSGATYSKSYSVWVRQYVNNAPTAATDSVDLVSKSESIIIDVLANDKDSNGDSLKVISVSKPSSGSVIINSDNTLTYTPSKRFKASDTFYYTVSDGKLSSNAYVYISYTSSGDTTDGSSTGGGGKGGGKGRNK